MIQDNIRVECAFTTAPDDPTPAYQDITQYALVKRGISINNHGRPDEYGQVQPTTCTVSLNNTDGRFTYGLASSPYYPNVKLRRKLRVSWRDPTVAGNLLAAEDASFEGGTVGNWIPGGSVPPTLTNSSTFADNGTKSLLITWGTGGTLPLGAVIFNNLVIGRSYIAQARVRVPTGSPDVYISISGSFGTSTSTKDAFVTLSKVFTATTNSVQFQIGASGSPTAGQQCYVDSAFLDEGTAVKTFTTTPSPINYRFTGYVNEWPTEWPSGAAYSEVAVTAVDRFSRMGAITAFRSIIEQEYQLDAPFAHYTMGDAAGSTQAGDVSTNGRPALAQTQLGSGGTLVFGTATGPGTDGLTALTLTPTNTTNGKYLSASLTNDGGFYRYFTDTIECFFLTSTAAAQTLISLGTVLEMDIDASGKLSAATYGATLTSPSSVADGLTHHAALTFTVSGGNVTMTLYLDGTQVGTDTSSYGSFVSLWNGTSIFSVGGEPAKSGVAGSVFNGVVAHAALYNTALTGTRILAHSNAGLNGFSGERSDQRIARYASYVGIPTAEQSLEVGLSTSIAHVDITGTPPLTAMQNVADTESGVLYMNGAGQLAFQARSHRYNTASSATLAASNIDQATKFVTNDALLVNDVTASRSGGITVRATNQPSITDYGTKQVPGNPLTLLTTSDNEVLDAANWKANTNAVPISRLPALTVKLAGASPTVQAAVLALDIGSRVTLSSLPTQAPAASLDQFIEGWSEVWSDQGVVFAFNASPASRSGVWILDSATYSQLDVSTRVAY